MIGGITLARPAAGALGDHVVARLVAVGAPVAETGDGTIDDVFLDLLHGVVVEFQPFHDARCEVLQQDIALLDELLDQLHPLGGFHVDAHASLSPVHRDGVGALRNVVLGDAKRKPSFVGAGLVLLHLDDVGAHVGQSLRCMGPRQHPREIQYGDIRQGTRFEFFHGRNLLDAFLIRTGAGAGRTSRPTPDQGHG